MERAFKYYQMLLNTREFSNPILQKTWRKNQNAEVNEEIVLYSIVDSITEAQGVTKVQISVNGNSEGKVRFSYDLSKM